MSEDHYNRNGIKPLVERTDDYHKWAESIQWKLMEQDYLWDVTQGIKVQTADENDLVQVKTPPGESQSHVPSPEAPRRLCPHGGS